MQIWRSKGRRGGLSIRDQKLTPTMLDCATFFKILFYFLWLSFSSLNFLPEVSSVFPSSWSARIFFSAVFHVFFWELALGQISLMFWACRARWDSPCDTGRYKYTWLYQFLILGSSSSKSPWVQASCIKYYSTYWTRNCGLKLCIWDDETLSLMMKEC